MGKASRRKAAKRPLGVQEKAMDMIKSIAGTKEVIVRTNLPQAQKISQALKTLLEASVPEGSPPAEYKAALRMISMAWNISLLDVGGQSEKLLEIESSIGGTDTSQQREIRYLIQGLINRKQALFPHDKRVIVSCEATVKNGKLSVSAAALNPPP